MLHVLVEQEHRFFKRLIKQGIVQSGSVSQFVQLGQKLARLNRDLAAAEKAKDGRNILICSLKGQIVQVTDQMAALEQQEDTRENSNEKDQNGAEDPT